MRKFLAAPLVVLGSLALAGCNSIAATKSTGTCLAHLKRAGTRCERGRTSVDGRGFFYQPSRTARPGSGPRASEVR
jgi:hypothetical protein